MKNLKTVGIFLSTTIFLFAIFARSARAENLEPAFRTEFYRALSPKQREGANFYLLSTPKADSTLTEPKTLDTLFNSFKPVTLFEGSQVSELPPFELKAPAHKITFVFVPGVFGEFIDTRMFEDVLSKYGTPTDWTVALAKAAAAKSPNATDPRFNMRTLQAEETPLDQVVHVVETDNIRIVFLNVSPFSLESLGNRDANAERFNRRLEKYIAIAGLPENMVFLGYSRGAVVGLEMLAQAKSDNAPWLKNVRALVTLGGVNFGSDLADLVNVPGTKSNLQFAALDTLTEKLHTYFESPAAVEGSLLEKAKIIAKNAKILADNTAKVTENTLAWGEFLIALAKSDPGMTPAKMIESNQNVDPQAAILTAFKFWMKMNLDNFVDDYANNIKGFIKLIREMKAAVANLTTEDRINWWKTRSLPTEGITYLILKYNQRTIFSTLKRSRN
jgi:pimeloyl-ACP methyl ester carboxylesterase